MSRKAADRSFDGDFRAWAVLWCTPGREMDIARTIEEDLRWSTCAVARRPQTKRGKLIGGGRAVLTGYVLVLLDIQAETAREQWEALLGDHDDIGGPIFDGLRPARAPDIQVERFKRSQDNNVLRELRYWLREHGHIRETPFVRRAKTRAQRRRRRREAAQKASEAANTGLENRMAA